MKQNTASSKTPIEHLIIMYLTIWPLGCYFEYKMRKRYKKSYLAFKQRIMTHAWKDGMGQIETNERSYRKFTA